MTEAVPVAPFIKSNRSLAQTTQQLRIDLAIHQKRIEELEMANDFLRERIAEMEAANDDERIEMIAKRRIEKKVRLIKTAAMKSISALERFVKVIDESIDEGAPLSASGLFDKTHPPVARTPLLEIVPESPPFSTPKVPSDVSNLRRSSKNTQRRACEQALSEDAEEKPRNGDLHVELRSSKNTQRRACEQALSEDAEEKPRNGDLHVELRSSKNTKRRAGEQALSEDAEEKPRNGDLHVELRSSKNTQRRAGEQALSEDAEEKPRNGDLHVELQEREPTSRRCKDEEYLLNVRIPSLEHHPFVTDKRRTPVDGERSSCNTQRSIAGFLDEVSPSSSTSTSHSEMREDSNDSDRSRSVISAKQEDINPAKQLSSGRPTRAASSKIHSYKEPNCRQKMRRTS